MDLKVNQNVNKTMLVEMLSFATHLTKTTVVISNTKKQNYLLAQARF